ncbi:hypothetical protein Tco_1549554 [Tanacetum coccineum]
MATKPKLDADLSGEPVDQTDYRSKIGSLMYLTSSRPDIVQAVCYCARYQARPTEKHLKEVKRSFRILKRVPFHMGTLVISYVSWMSKKQDCTAMSSAEAEYVALSASCAQVMWMRTQLRKLNTIADMFTKALPERKVSVSRQTIGRMPTRIELTLEQSQQGVSNEVLGRMPTKIELTLEQSQQGVSNDVLNPTLLAGNLSRKFFESKPDHSGCGGGGSVEVVSVVAVKLEGTPADAVRALKKLVCFRLSTAIL